MTNSYPIKLPYGVEHTGESPEALRYLSSNIVVVGSDSTPIFFPLFRKLFFFMPTTTITVRKLKELNAPAEKLLDLAMYQFFSQFEGGSAEADVHLGDFLKHLSKDKQNAGHADEVQDFRVAIVKLLEILEVIFINNDENHLRKYLECERLYEETMKDALKFESLQFLKIIFKRYS